MKLILKKHTDRGRRGERSRVSSPERRDEVQIAHVVAAVQVIFRSLYNFASFLLHLFYLQDVFIWAFVVRLYVELHRRCVQQQYIMAATLFSCCRCCFHLSVDFVE